MSIQNIQYIEFLDYELHNVVQELDSWLVSNTIQTNNTNIPRTNSSYVKDILVYYDAENGWVVGVYFRVGDENG